MMGYFAAFRTDSSKELPRVLSSSLPMEAEEAMANGALLDSNILKGDLF